MKKKIFAAFLIFVMVLLAIVPQRTDGAAKTKLSKSKATMEVDSKLTLKLENAGDEKITWTSGNKKIASVTSKGTVTAKSEGTVKVTAKQNGKKYVCTITVVDSNKEVTPTPTPTPTPKPKASDYSKKENYSDGFDYTKVSRYPSKYKGNKYAISGIVTQVESYDWYDTVVMRINVDGDSEKNLYVEFEKDILDANILLDDEVTLYAEYVGQKTYTTVLGNSLTVPEVKAYMIDIKIKEEIIVPTEEDIEVVNEYTYSTSWYKYRFIVIKNNSKSTVEISTSSLAYDKSGKMVAVGSAEIDAIGAGCTSLIIENYDTDSEISHFETEWSIEEVNYYESVIQDLTYKENSIDGGAIFQVKNNGKESAEFVKGYVLFFKNGKVVDYDWTYFVDGDSEIKPSKTISKQMDTYEDFDKIEFYLDGRKDK